MTFDAACFLIETALSGTFRAAIVTDLATSNDSRKALEQLRASMRSHVWKAGAHHLRLDKVVPKYDSRTRQDGFHVLHDWDGIADTVNDDIIPVDVLNFVMDTQRAGQPDKTALAILLDYYFLHVLALLSLRVWDEGQADDNLGRLHHALGDLQGPTGSGQQFAADAETLILIATSHYELEEWGYDALLDKVRTLGQSHQAKIALGHAVSMGCHLRFGFEATYARDTVAMRNDNSADYPWLCFALATVMREYSRMHDEGIQGLERERLVEAMLNGLTPDAGAFVGDRPPASLSAHDAERSEFCERFQRYRSDLLEEAERHRPSARAYSPISFFFNFSHNILKGMVVDAVRWGEPWTLTLNDLLTGIPRDEPPGDAKRRLATTLMGYARSSPDRIRGRLTPAIVYDPRSGHRAFALTLRQISEQASGSTPG